MGLEVRRLKAIGLAARGLEAVGLVERKGACDQGLRTVHLRT
jgi:hypothetical protein